MLSSCAASKNFIIIKQPDVVYGYGNEIFEKWYKAGGEHVSHDKTELFNAGMEDVFKFWGEFNCENHSDPKPFFKELFKRSLAKFIKRESNEYKDKRFLDSLQTMGRKILYLNLPYEIKMDGPMIREFHFVDNNK